MTITKHNSAAHENSSGRFKFIPAKTAATILNVHPKTILRWADSGLIHRHKINARVVLFDEAEVIALIKRSKVG